MFSTHERNEVYIITSIDFSIKKFTPPEDGIHGQRERKKSIIIPIMYYIRIETFTTI
jgi:hypothetical protein